MISGLTRIFTPHSTEMLPATSETTSPSSSKPIAPLPKGVGCDVLEPWDQAPGAMYPWASALSHSSRV